MSSYFGSKIKFWNEIENVVDGNWVIGLFKIRYTSKKEQ